MTALKRIFFIVLSFFAFILGNKITYVFKNFPLNEEFTENFYMYFSNEPIKIYLGKDEILGGIIGVIILILFYLYHKYDRKNFKEKAEHGSAEWGERKDIEIVEDKQEEKNKIFTQTEKMSINTRKTFKNNNTLIIRWQWKWKNKIFRKTKYHANE